MRTAGLALFGWLVPGGTYLLMRRYAQAAIFAAVVVAAVAAGTALRGGGAWPQPAELDGLDGFTALVFKAGALGKMLAGVPYFAANFFNGSPFLETRFHEQGATLLLMAGGFNLLGIASALDLRKKGAR